MDISGIDFDVAWENRKRTNYAGVLINGLGLKELKKSKKAASRPQDLLDLEIEEDRVAWRQGDQGGNGAD